MPDLLLDGSETKRELTLYKNRVSKELDAARMLQSSIMPSPQILKHVAQSRNVSVSWLFHPSSELSGDFFTVMPLDDMRVGVLIADLTGHGIAAAINAFRLHGLVHPVPSLAAEPGPFMSFLSRRLSELLPNCHFATGFYAVLDPWNGELECVGAGFTPQFFVERPGAKAREIDAGGLPLGILADAHYSRLKFSLDMGGVLFCYSDALIETRDAWGNCISREDVQNWVSEALSAGGDVVDAVWEAAADRLGTKLPDDLTLVALHRKKSN